MWGGDWLQILKNQCVQAIPGQKKVKITEMGNITEIMYMEKNHVGGFPIKKISKTEYVLLDTGEIKEYSFHAENRSQNKDNLRRTFKKIRELINTNFVGDKNELAFTITYKENMTDYKVLYKDFEKFMKRLKYKYPNTDYISVVEPQGRGAWHCHILLKLNDVKKAYIANKEVAELWGHGFVSVKAISKEVDNLGAYLSAYLGDVEINDNNLNDLVSQGIVQPGKSFSIKEIEVDGKAKKFIKGGRLHLYPVGMNIYRCSRGIKQPKVSHISYNDAKKIVGAATPNYSSHIKILDDDGTIINGITYEQYNMKRLKNK